jgi:hypothetical protein
MIRQCTDLRQQFLAGTDASDGWQRARREHPCRRSIRSSSRVAGEDSTVCIRHRTGLLGPRALNADSLDSIYRPAKTATQSGDWHGHHWRMDWDVLHKGHRWENPLMGWQSSADFMQGTHLNFKSKDDAIRFANKQGYEYFVQEPNERRIIPKAYATQFVHSPKQLKQVRTK